MYYGIKTQPKKQPDLQPEPVEDWRDKPEFAWLKEQNNETDTSKEERTVIHEETIRCKVAHVTLYYDKIWALLIFPNKKTTLQVFKADETGFLPAVWLENPEEEAYAEIRVEQIECNLKSEYEYKIYPEKIYLNKKIFTQN